MAPANGVIGFGSDNKTAAAYWAYTAKTNFFEVSENLKTITKIDAESVSTDGNDLVYFVADDDATASYKVVKTVIIVKVKEGTVAPVDNTAIVGGIVNTVTIASGKVDINDNSLAIRNSDDTAGKDATKVYVSYEISTWNTSAGTWNAPTVVKSATLASVAKDTYINAPANDLSASFIAVAGTNCKVTVTVTCDECTKTFDPVLVVAG